jgi:enoyl-CoA hydratase
MSADGQLSVSDSAGVRTITIDRPAAKNALNRRLRTELCALLAAADQDPQVRAVILTGRDPVFCAGVDFKETDQPFDPYAAQFAINPGRALRAMRTPVICAVNGACVSGGLELALSASFVVASERSSFADTHARLNAVPTWGLTALLPRAVGVRRARELSLTGRFVRADEAQAIGLVNHVVPHDTLLSFTHDLAEHIADTAAVGEILWLYERGTDLSFEAALALETDHTSRRTLDAGAFAAAGHAFLQQQHAKDGHDGISAGE